jgi:Na+-translocating ferredoxin:NAD+ oxidoreductase RnfA subunit
VNILSLFFTLVVLENLVLTYGLGVDLMYFREGKKWKFRTEFFRTTLLLTLGSLGFWVIYQLLVLLAIEFLIHLLLFVYVTALVQLFRNIESKPTLSPVLGWLLESNNVQSPLFLGFMLISVIQSWSPLEILVMSVAGAFGISVVTMLIIHLRQTKKLEPIPEILKGEPMFFFVLGILAATFSLLDRVLFFIFIP